MEGLAKPGCYHYKRRRPENTDIYKVLSNHLEPFLAERHAREKPLPKFVCDELRAFLRCGILKFGFLRLKCQDCHDEKIVAFSCKKRGFCPSCCAKRQAETSMHLCSNILPHARYRQFVVTVPYPLRAWINYNHKLMADIHKIIIKSIRELYNQIAGEHHIKNPLFGAITFVQRFGSAANLNTHFHILALDGCYIEQKNESYVFRKLRDINHSDVKDLMSLILFKVKKFLQKKGFIDKEKEIVDQPEADSLFKEFPALDDVTANSMQLKSSFFGNKSHKLIKHGKRHASLVRDIDSHEPLCHNEQGFSIHAKRCIKTRQRKELASLISYVARGPLSNDRVQLLENGNVLLKLKRPFSDGTHSLELSPY